jgi:hypothetical protein
MSEIRCFGFESGCSLSRWKTVGSMRWAVDRARGGRSAAAGSRQAGKPDLRARRLSGRAWEEARLTKARSGGMPPNDGISAPALSGPLAGDPISDVCVCGKLSKNVGLTQVPQSSRTSARPGEVHPAVWAEDRRVAHGISDRSASLLLVGILRYLFR